MRQNPFAPVLLALGVVGQAYAQTPQVPQAPDPSKAPAPLNYSVKASVLCDADHHLAAFKGFFMDQTKSDNLPPFVATSVPGVGTVIAFLPPESDTGSSVSKPDPKGKAEPPKPVEISPDWKAKAGEIIGDFVVQAEAGCQRQEDKAPLPAVPLTTAGYQVPPFMVRTSAL